MAGTDSFTDKEEKNSYCLNLKPLHVNAMALPLLTDKKSEAYTGRLSFLFQKKGNYKGSPKISIRGINHETYT